MIDELIDVVLSLEPFLNRFDSYIFYIKDAWGRYVYFNRGFVQFAGGDPLNMLYKTSEYVFKDKNIPQVAHMVQDESKILSGEMGYSVTEMKTIRANGNYQYIRFVKLPIFSKTNGKVIGTLCHGMDVSDFFEEDQFLYDLLLRQLSPGERTYLHFYSQGIEDAAEIARAIGTTKETIYNYPSEIRKKLKIKNRDDKDLESEEFDRFIRGYKRVMRSHFE
jgi:DNA-binding CsgD family transcriptional regulator